MFTDKTEFRHFGHGQSLEGGVDERSNLLRGFQPGPENRQNLAKNDRKSKIVPFGPI